MTTKADQLRNAPSALDRERRGGLPRSSPCDTFTGNVYPAGTHWLKKSTGRVLFVPRGWPTPDDDDSWKRSSRFAWFQQDAVLKNVRYPSE